MSKPKKFHKKTDFKINQLISKSDLLRKFPLIWNEENIEKCNFTKLYKDDKRISYNPKNKNQIRKYNELKDGDYFIRWIEIKKVEWKYREKEIREYAYKVSMKFKEYKKPTYADIQEIIDLGFNTYNEWYPKDSEGMVIREDMYMLWNLNFHQLYNRSKYYRAERPEKLEKYLDKIIKIKAIILLGYYKFIYKQPITKEIKEMLKIAKKYNKRFNEDVIKKYIMYRVMNLENLNLNPYIKKAFHAFINFTSYYELYHPYIKKYNEFNYDMNYFYDEFDYEIDYNYETNILKKMDDWSLKYLEEEFKVY